MLILSRRAAECIYLGDEIVLTIVAVGNDKVRIGVKAPQGVRILRNELEADSREIAPSTLQFPIELTRDTESSSSDLVDETASPSVSISNTKQSTNPTEAPKGMALKAFLRQTRRAA